MIYFSVETSCPPSPDRPTCEVPWLCTPDYQSPIRLSPRLTNGDKACELAGCVGLEFDLWTREEEQRDTVDTLQERRQNYSTTKWIGYFGWLSAVLGAPLLLRPSKETMEHYPDQVNNQILSIWLHCVSVIAYWGKPAEQSSVQSLKSKLKMYVDILRVRLSKCLAILLP